MTSESPEPAHNRDRALTPTAGIAILFSFLLVLGALFATASMANVEAELKGASDAAAQKTVSGNQWSGSIGDLIQLSNNRAGASNVRARVNFTIESGSKVIGDELQSLRITMDTGQSMFRGTEMSSLRSVKIDTEPDGTTDEDITTDATDWSVERNGNSITVAFDSEYKPEKGDSIIVVFDDVANPEKAGSYGVRSRANGKGKWHHGEVEIIHPVAPTG
jgi:Flp pilus assembly protein TadG